MPTRILFQGDSITDCGRSCTGGAGFNNYGVSGGYPGVIAADLYEKYPEKFEVLNRGISGNRIVDLYARWKIDAINLKPDVISILIGVNDSWHEVDSHNGVEVPRYERIYRELLRWTVESLPEVKLVLMEPFLGDTELCDKMRPEVQERQKIVKGLAEEFKAKFLPTQSILDDALARAPYSYWLADGVHPTLAGHRLFANAWLKLMEL